MLIWCPQYWIRTLEASLWFSQVLTPWITQLVHRVQMSVGLSFYTTGNNKSMQQILGFKKKKKKKEQRIFAIKFHHLRFFHIQRPWFLFFRFAFLVNRRFLQETRWKHFTNGWCWETARARSWLWNTWNTSLSNTLAWPKLISQFNLAVFSWNVLVIPHNPWRALPPERNCWSLKSCHWFQLSLKCHAYKCVPYLGIYISGGKGKIWRKESVKENKKVIKWHLTEAVNQFV